MDFSKTLFRCSALGKLLTDPRSKNEELSETTKSYLIEVYINEVYGRKKDISVKYTKKGLEVEEEAIQLYSEYKLGEYFEKNEKHFTNEWIKGTPDVVGMDRVYDCKSPYDIFSYFDAMSKPLNKDYYAQLQGYMWLTGKTEATLFYALIDTPKPLIFDEQRRLQWKMNATEETPEFIEACDVIETNLTYKDLPLEERIHEIEFSIDYELIEKLKTRIMASRVFLAEFHLKMLQKKQK